MNSFNLPPELKKMELDFENRKYSVNGIDCSNCTCKIQIEITGHKVIFAVEKRDKEKDIGYYRYKVADSSRFDLWFKLRNYFNNF